MAIICGSMTSDCPDCGKELRYYVKGHIRFVDQTVAYCQDCHRFHQDLKVFDNELNIFHETKTGFKRANL